jgi:hypothetical protein
MYTEKYAETFKSFVDTVFLNKPYQLVAPKPVDHSILLDELALLKEKFLQSGSDEHRFSAAVITAAMAVIIGI